MLSIFPRVVLLSMLIGIAQAASLAPEHELQRLLIVAKESINSADFNTTRTVLDKIEALGIDPGADYHYYLGQLEANTGNLQAASDAFINYVNAAGSEGQYYQTSLRMITQLERQQEAAKPQAPPEDISDLLVGEGDQYLSQLRQLYLAKDDISALIEHINGLLAANVYVPGRIRYVGSKEGIVYKITTNAQQELVVQESDYLDERPDHNLFRISVYGVDPYLRSECDFNQRRCWLNHPIERQNHWITIADNQEALTELAKAMTQLIRRLQN